MIVGMIHIPPPSTSNRDNGNDNGNEQSTTHQSQLQIFKDLIILLKRIKTMNPNAPIVMIGEWNVEKRKLSKIFSTTSLSSAGKSMMMMVKIMDTETVKEENVYYPRERKGERKNKSFSFSHPSHPPPSFSSISSHSSSIKSNTKHVIVISTITIIKSTIERAKRSDHSISIKINLGIINYSNSNHDHDHDHINEETEIKTNTNTKMRKDMNTTSRIKMNKMTKSLMWWIRSHDEWNIFLLQQQQQKDQIHQDQNQRKDDKSEIESEASKGPKNQINDLLRMIILNISKELKNGNYRRYLDYYYSYQQRILSRRNVIKKNRKKYDAGQMGFTFHPTT
jgi:hypothetical protein